MMQYHFVNFFSPSEPDNSAKLGVIPASQINIFLLGGMNEQMNEWETPMCLEEEQRLWKPHYPWHGVQHSTAVPSSEQSYMSQGDMSRKQMVPTPLSAHRRKSSWFCGWRTRDISLTPLSFCKGLPIGEDASAQPRADHMVWVGNVA